MVAVSKASPTPLNQVTGVQQADVSLEQNNAVINFDDSQTNETALKQAIEDAGFEAS